MVDKIYAHRFWLIAGVALATTSCSAPSGSTSGAVGANANVYGKVSWKAKPVPVGMIVFENQDGSKASYAIVDGQYGHSSAAQTAKAGPVTVRITGGNPIKKGKKQTIVHSGGIVPDTIESIIPDDYNKSSKLTAELKAGDNSLDYALPQG